MKLKHIKIKNFRSVQTLDIELPQVCAIVGPNNAGKSNILEAIRRVLAGDWGPRASSFSDDDVYLRDPELLLQHSPQWFSSMGHTLAIC
jgi:putative ATP-dependent endonuclease of the OLD family